VPRTRTSPVSSNGDRHDLIRLPVAWDTALAMAADTPTTPISPAMDTPSPTRDPVGVVRTKWKESLRS
jgi:hypothetical protein